jgi:thiol-disulfide isomerase/thioredoxin
LKAGTKRVLVQWGANASEPCVRLCRELESNELLKHEMLYEYVSVMVDVSRIDKHLELAKKYGADVTEAELPLLTVLDADGKVLAHRQRRTVETQAAGRTGEESSYDHEQVLAFLKRYEAPPLIANDVLKYALIQAKSEGKVVFLHFGAPWCHWCHWCHHLDDWLARPAIAAIMSKAFVDCQIDMDRMTGGADMLKGLVGEEPSIAWFGIFDHDRVTLATSDAADGNIGFPSRDYQIAHFVGMLAKAGWKLSPDDIKTLERSLVEDMELRKR